GVNPIRSRPCSPSLSRRAVAVRSSAARITCRAFSSRTSPSEVRRTDRRVRTNSRTPRARSSCWIRFVSAGWATCSRAAARVKCSSSARAANDARASSGGSPVILDRNYNVIKFYWTGMTEGEHRCVMTQTWSPSGYAYHAAFVPALGAGILEKLAPVAGERILDLGCGDGSLTEQLIQRGARVVGVDASPDMVAAARARGIDAQVMDATQLTFEAEFDAVFSNAVLHWIHDQDAVLAGVARALVWGGRFV